MPSAPPTPTPAEPKPLSITLNSQHRANVLHEMLQHRFKAEVESHFPRWADLALRTYDRLYDASTQKKMKALPQGWLPERAGLKVMFGSDVTELQFSGAMGNCHRALVRGVVQPAELVRRVLEKHNAEGYRAPVVLALDATDELSIAYGKLLAEHTELRDRIAATSRQVEAALGNFNTTKQVADAWPEAAPFLPGATAPRSAVAIPRADLNKLLGLSAQQVAA